MAYYAVPDIHGNLEGLIDATESILIDFDYNNDVIVFLGDYIDRGNNSFEVVEYLYNLQNKLGKDKVICLKGNHDDMFLKFLENPREISFLMNDTDLKTIKSFIGSYFSLCELHLNYNYSIIDLQSMEDYTFKIISYIKSTQKGHVYYPCPIIYQLKNTLFSRLYNKFYTSSFFAFYFHFCKCWYTY